jgi:hypothetical protein
LKYRPATPGTSAALFDYVRKNELTKDLEMKALSLLTAVLFLGLTSYAQDNLALKEESIKLVEQGIASNSLTYQLVGHPREGASQTQDGKIRTGHTSGEIAQELVSFMRRTMSGPQQIENNQVSFSCNQEASHCDLRIVGTLSAEDQAAGVMDRAVLNFSIVIENGHAVSIKDNRLTLHLYAFGVQ